MLKQKNQRPSKTESILVTLKSDILVSNVEAKKSKAFNFRVHFSIHFNQKLFETLISEFENVN